MPNACDIAVTGDSCTYGIGVASEHAWPMLLGHKTGLCVYNAAMGAWGVLQYGMIFPELLKMRPKTVLVAISMGTDFLEAFLYCHNYPSTYAKRFWKPEYDAYMEDMPVLSFAQQRAEMFQQLIVQYKGRPWSEFMETVRQSDIPDAVCATVAGKPYLLTPRTRFLQQDLNSNPVRAGLEISQGILSDIKEAAALGSVNLMVVLVPTKEYLVYRTNLDREMEPSRSLEELGRAESELTSLCSDWLNRERIHHLDLSPLLADLLHMNIYKLGNPDGHPTAEGHIAMASMVQRALASMNFI